MNKVIVITGPTAVGKTKLSIALAKHFNTELINGDAYQVYDNLNIGVAKPTIEELKEVKHHLMGYYPSNKEYNVAIYQKDVRSKIDELISRSKLPIIIGGSGLYIDSVISDYDFSTPSRNEDNYLEYSNEQLYNILLQLDKEVALKNHPNNRKRVIRAIELIKSNNTSKEDLNKRCELCYDALIICLVDDRESLYNRINKRVDEMIDNKLVEEVIHLKTNNLFSKTSIEAIGYKEIIKYLNNEITLNEAIDQIKINSRHFAKRQLTWFRHHHNDITKNIMINQTNFTKTIDEVISCVNDFLIK